MTPTLSRLSTDLTGWAVQQALPLWWTVGTDHAGAGFYEALDGEASPIIAHRRARVQARQIYVYATAPQLGWDGPWREAVDHGLDFFLNAYRRDDGLFRTVAAADGTAVDDTAWLYDQAFALFAMAQAAKALPDRFAALNTHALALAEALQGWRLPEGGLCEPPAVYDRQSNPHMHLLEAALAWAEVDPSGPWDGLADEVVALALTRFIDANGVLHEFFQPGWRLADGVDGRIVEPGHQFEWAWLLERWARLRSRADAHQAALRLFQWGVRGVDRARGVANQQLLDDGILHDPVGRLWPQTEWLKAALILGNEEEATRAAMGLNLYLDRNPRGLWWDKLRADGTFVDEPAPASSFYHIVCAIAELKAAVE